MKRTTKRLQLSRESLRRLDIAALGHAAAAAGKTFSNGGCTSIPIEACPADSEAVSCNFTCWPTDVGCPRKP